MYRWYLLLLIVPVGMFLAAGICSLSAYRIKKKVGAVEKQKEREEYAQILFLYAFEMVLVFGLALTVACILE